MNGYVNSIVDIDLPEIEDFGPKLDFINSYFKIAAETLDKSKCFIPCSYKDLEWKKFPCGWRFCFQDRQVLELPVGDRIRLIKLLPGVMKVAETVMRDALEGVSTFNSLY